MTNLRTKTALVIDNVRPEELRGLLRYDQETGLLTWRVRVSNSVRAGTVAGTVDKKGYTVIGIARRYYKAHRLAWLYMTGSWPEDQIDHADGDKSNNRWFNLRAATASTNKANSRAYRRNQSGFKGVHRLRHKGQMSGWRAQIRVNYQLIHLGTFDTAEAAHAAYADAARKHFGEFGRAA